jgi:hypothetical protein
MVADDPESFADLDGHISLHFPGFLYPDSGGRTDQPADPPPSTNPISYVTTTKFNGQSAFAVVSLSASVTTDNKGNVVSSTLTTTTAYFSTKEKNAGQFLGATQSSSTYDNNTQTTSTSSSRSLDFGQATRFFGPKAIGNAANVAAGGHDALLHFPAAVGKDARAHPIKYAIHAAGIALPFMHAPQVVEGIATGLEALITAFDLGKEAHEH